MFNEELVIGEVYLERIDNFDFISKHVSAKESAYIKAKDERFSNKGLNIRKSSVVRKATQEEKDWLEHCIKLNKFVSLEDFKKVDKLRFEVGKWYTSPMWANFYIKCSKFDGENVSIEEKIVNKEHIFQKGNYHYCLETYVELTDLSEIEEYLPKDHPDKVKKWIPKEGDLVTLVSGESFGGWIQKNEIIKLGGEYWHRKSINKILLGEELAAITKKYPSGGGCDSQKNGDVKIRPCTQAEIETYNNLGLGAKTTDVPNSKDIDIIDIETGGLKSPLTPMWLICEDCNGSGRQMEARLYPNGHTEVYVECKTCDGNGEIEADGEVDIPSNEVLFSPINKTTKKDIPIKINETSTTNVLVPLIKNTNKKIIKDFQINNFQTLKF